MVLIVGGRCQGKLDYVQELIQKGELNPVSGITVGKDLEPEAKPDSEEALQAGILCHAELYIRAWMKEKKDPAVWINRLCEENPDVIVIADEIGYGIVPTNSFEREYRETAGRLCQRLASESEAVYRVVCGIGNRMK